MNNTVRIIIVLAVLAAVAGVIIAKQRSRATPRSTSTATGESASAPVDTPGSAKGLPRLVDLGQGTCAPCKALKPIIEQLGRDFAGQLEVETIDISQDEGARIAFKVELIPTLVFLDADGNELDRQVGYMSREQILGRWRELGHDFEQPGADAEGG